MIKLLIEGDKMKEKKIPVKNYVIYGVIVVITIVIVMYLNEWYKAYKKSELNESYIAKYVNEVNYDEFSNYVLENPDGIIYIDLAHNEHYTWGDCSYDVGPSEGPFKSYRVCDVVSSESFGGERLKMIAPEGVSDLEDRFYVIALDDAYDDSVCFLDSDKSYFAFDVLNNDHARDIGYGRTQTNLALNEHKYTCSRENCFFGRYRKRIR